MQLITITADGREITIRMIYNKFSFLLIEQTSDGSVAESQKTAVSVVIAVSNAVTVITLNYIF